MILDRNMLTRILDQVGTEEGEFAEIYVEERKVNQILCEDDKIEKIHTGLEMGVGMRLVREGKTAYIYSNDLREVSLLRAAALLRQSLAGSGRALDRETVLHLMRGGFELEFSRLPGDVSFQEKTGAVLEANHRARQVSPDIRQVSVGIGDLQKTWQIANTEGELVEDKIARVRMMIQVIAAREGIIQTGYESRGGVAGWELWDKTPFTDIAAEAAARAVEMLSAPPAPTGRMPVVMSAEAGGTMIHEACGHGLEADLVQKGLSVYKNRLGHKVAADQVTVIDDATLAGLYGSYRFDDEGILGQRTVLIEKGILRQYMYDRLTAAREGKASTGNGRRESYQHKPVVRMSNTFIAPGPDDPRDIMASTSHGLFVKKMGGGQVNTTNGDFVFEVQEGYIIEKGRVKHPVRGATLSGNGPRVLLDIDRVGNDLGYAIGICGKDGQGVPVADAQPTIRIKELVVGGTFMPTGPQTKKIHRKQVQPWKLF